MPRVRTRPTSTYLTSFLPPRPIPRKGFVAVPDFASPEEVAALRTRAGALVDAFDPASVTSVFSTKDDNQAQSRDPYFLASASNISFFFEEKAFDEAGALRQPKELSINKIGHGGEETGAAASGGVWSRELRVRTCWVCVRPSNTPTTNTPTTNWRTKQ